MCYPLGDSRKTLESLGDFTLKAKGFGVMVVRMYQINSNRAKVSPFYR